MKKEISGRPFDSDDDIITALDYILEVQDDNFYSEGICMLHYRWTMCVNVGWDYAEKQISEVYLKLTMNL